MNDSDALLNQLKEIIQTFQQSLQSHLPALECEINAIITNKVQNKNTIEYNLDVLISLTDMGVGNELFIKLLDYYKTLMPKVPLFIGKNMTKRKSNLKIFIKSKIFKYKQ
jgi:hypothetical protein